MIKKLIPEPDLKLLIDFLRLCVNDDVEFQAAYESVMSSFPVQTRLFKALTDRKDAFVVVKIKRKDRKILLNFSALPNPQASAVPVESEQKNDSLVVPLSEQREPLQVEKTEFVTNSNLVQPEILPLGSSPSEKKRKGRGKAKKPSLPRSSVSFLLDDSDIQLLNELALKKDVSFSQLMRLAVRRLLSASN